VQYLSVTENRRAGRRRVFVEDARRNGQFLRVTWHGDRHQFVVSNWEDTVCVGATRVPVEQASSLVGLLVEGLAEAAEHPPAPEAAAPHTLAEHLMAWWHGRPQQALVVPSAHAIRIRHRRSA
jgi:hypothetical protein